MNLIIGIGGMQCFSNTNVVISKRFTDHLITTLAALCFLEKKTVLLFIVRREKSIISYE